MSPQQSVYTAPARALHWVVALAVIATIPVGALMVEQGWPRATQNAMYIFHKNMGVAILVLMVLRLGWRLASPPPPLPARVSSVQRRIAGATHAALYLLLFVMAVSGYVRVVAGGFPLESLDAIGFPRLVAPSRELAETAKSVHAAVRFPLVGLIALHVGAAVWHGAVRRDGVFGRMWVR